MKPTLDDAFPERYDARGPYQALMGEGEPVFFVQLQTKGTSSTTPWTEPTPMLGDSFIEFPMSLVDRTGGVPCNAQEPCRATSAGEPFRRTGTAAAAAAAHGGGTASSSGERRICCASTAAVMAEGSITERGQACPERNAAAHCPGRVRPVCDLAQRGKADTVCRDDTSDIPSAHPGHPGASLAVSVNNIPCCNSAVLGSTKKNLACCRSQTRWPCGCWQCGRMR